MLQKETLQRTNPQSYYRWTARCPTRANRAFGKHGGIDFAVIAVNTPYNTEYPMSLAHANPQHHRHTPATANRHEVLRDALLETVDLLQRRRADLVDETFIDNYVALGWLEWHGGQLRLSPLGHDICLQMSERLAPLDS
jgi:hypothetical protein